MAAPALRATGAIAKSPDAFRTISEVATDLDVPQHVLRFWESRFAQIKPVKRAGGRRFYRPDDVDLLRGIRALLYVDGLTIRGVQKILKERGLRHVVMMGRGQAPAPYAAPPKIVAPPPAEKKPEPKKRPSHLRAVPSPMSLPFFDLLENEPASPAPAPKPAELKPAAAPKAVAAAAPVVASPANEERIKLKALLAELEGLKKGLVQARKRATI
ncbi:MAG: MerR family transcriptional regulator [Alphaproteobacteria bacterium]|nr:MerR family transcriptional regulator [Alphaproteobacteria bacterium]